MYEYHNNILSIPARLLYHDWRLISYDNYQFKCRTQKLIRTKTGKGPGNEAFVSFYDMPMQWQEMAIHKLGNPREVAVQNKLEQYIQPDPAARAFFEQHRRPNGRPLSDEQRTEKTTNAMILNAIKMLFNSGEIHKVNRTKRKNIWPGISDAVNSLPPNKYTYNLPGNYRMLQRRYIEYVNMGYHSLIHRGEGNINSIKITENVGQWLIAKYALPVKYNVQEVYNMYENQRYIHNWPELSPQRIDQFLNEPQNKRIWTLGRHGKEAYNQEYKHTLTRRRDNWYSNAYWAIDGSKLDWIHLWDSASNKMGAKLKMDVVFDVFSEKIIGYNKSFTEHHADHFAAVKMAVCNTQCRPGLFTYDNQSGHTMARMQRFYDNIVARNKGLHYSHRAYEHNSPVEQLFSRFQQQVIAKFWFSDKQNITVRRNDNKPNIEFINEHKVRLRSTNDLDAAWELAVEKWNSAPHPHYKNMTRNQVYEQHRRTDERITILDIVENMYVEELRRPVTYRANGIKITIGDSTYMFEVYQADNSIDIEFRRRYVGRQFIIRYDPELLDAGVQLCIMNPNAELELIAIAQPKRQHEVVPILMQPGDKEQWYKDYEVRNLEYQRDKAALQAVRAATGITPEAEIEHQELEIKLKRSLTKHERTTVESNEFESIYSRL